jgi:hypothetical protein
MKLPTYQLVAQMAAAFAVVVSLVLVAYELKLSRDLGMADLYLQRAAMLVEYKMDTYQNEILNDAYKQKVEDPASLTKEQIDRMTWDADIVMTYNEAAFQTNALGVLPESEWLSVESSVEKLAETICYVRFWNNIKTSYNTDFAAWVDRIFANVRPPECPLDG